MMVWKSVSPFKNLKFRGCILSFTSTLFCVSFKINFLSSALFIWYNISTPPAVVWKPALRSFGHSVKRMDEELKVGTPNRWRMVTVIGYSFRLRILEVNHKNLFGEVWFMYIYIYIYIHFTICIYIYILHINICIFISFQSRNVWFKEMSKMETCWVSIPTIWWWPWDWSRSTWSSTLTAAYEKGPKETTFKSLQINKWCIGLGENPTNLRFRKLAKTRFFFWGGWLLGIWMVLIVDS